MWVRIINTYMKKNNKTTGNRSLLRQTPIEAVTKAVAESMSYSEVIRKLGLDVKTIYLNTLREIVVDNNISTEHFSRRLIGKNNGVASIYDSDDFLLELKENSNISPSTLKRGLKSQQIIPYECAECPVVGEYNNKPIALQIDHINGINNDNRIENLRWLCPNCHSQSETFAGRNARKYSIKYCECGKLLTRHNKTGKCIKCFDYSSLVNTRNNEKKFEVVKEELEILIREKPMTEIGKIFGVSDNAVKKRARKLGIDMEPMRGHWTKKK